AGICSGLSRVSAVATNFVVVRPSPMSARLKYQSTTQASERTPKRSVPSPWAMRGMVTSATRPGTTWPTMLRPVFLISSVPRARPSARSGGIVGNGEVRFVRAAEGRADTLDQFGGEQQPRGFDHAALAMHPLGLDRVQPGALARQIAGDDPHAAAAPLDG